MKGKVLGIFGLLVALCVFVTLMTADPWYHIGSSTFLQTNNIENLLSRTAMYGILGIGVAFVIITSGIDLSIGSLVCLSGILLALFLHVEYQPQFVTQVSQVDSIKSTFEVSGDLQRLKEGDRIRYTGGRRADSGLFTVKFVSDKTIAVTEIIPRDDTQGQIALAIPISKIERSKAADSDDDENQFSLVIAEKLDLNAGDKVTLVHPVSGLKTETITKASQTADSTELILANDPGDRVTSEWLALPQKRHQRMSAPVAILAVLFICGLLGLIHGLLVTRAGLQPFVVTLSGLLIYRGLSRWLTDDNPAGLGEYSDSLCQIGSGNLNLLTTAGGNTFGIPYPFFFLIATGIIAAVFLNRTIWGRYLLALGRNEQAARFSGINTGKVTMMAFVICSTLAGLGGMLFALDYKSISPSSFGNFFELYAIAAAVLGGCSLRGGEGSIVGVIIGTAVMQVLNNLILLLKIPGSLEFAIIGSVILVGVLVDEVFRRMTAERRRKQRLQA
ncbi:MAG: ABC transporter permease [Fuerstiella sp.]